jgi:hypothetical protein
VTWGGSTFNTLLAAILTREAPGGQFQSSDIDVTGRLPAATISLQEVREWARRAEQANDLPISVAEKFTSGSRFIGELSPRLGGEEKRRSIPWRPFHRWLDRVSGIDMAGSVPSSPGRYSLRT